MPTQPPADRPLHLRPRPTEAEQEPTPAAEQRGSPLVERLRLVEGSFLLVGTRQILGKSNPKDLRFHKIPIFLGCSFIVKDRFQRWIFRAFVFIRLHPTSIPESPLAFLDLAHELGNWTAPLLCWRQVAVAEAEIERPRAPGASASRDRARSRSGRPVSHVDASVSFWVRNTTCHNTSSGQEVNKAGEHGEVSFAKTNPTGRCLSLPQ